MMEQSNACEGHSYVIFVTLTDNVVISYRSAWLRYKAYAASARTFNIVAERKEGVAAEAKRR